MSEIMKGKTEGIENYSSIESTGLIEKKQSEKAIKLLQEVQVLMNQDVDDNWVYANIALQVKEKIEEVINLLQEE